MQTPRPRVRAGILAGLCGGGAGEGRRTGRAAGAGEDGMSRSPTRPGRSRGVARRRGRRAGRQSVFVHARFDGVDVHDVSPLCQLFIRLTQSPPIVTIITTWSYISYAASGFWELRTISLALRNLQAGIGNHPAEAAMSLDGSCQDRPRLALFRAWLRLTRPQGTPPSSPRGGGKGLVQSGPSLGNTARRDREAAQPLLRPEGPARILPGASAPGKPPPRAGARTGRKITPFIHVPYAPSGLRVDGRTPSGG